MSKRKNTRSALASLLLGFAGQANTLVIPRPFISLCHGDHLAALLLSQILYWQDRTDDPNGWFSKSYEDWDEELGLTETQVKRLIRGDKRTKTPMFKLEDIGVETKLSRAKAYNGAATMHYRVNLEVFEALVLSNARNPALSGNDDLSNAQNDDPSNARNVITETTAEITTEVIAPNGVDEIVSSGSGEQPQPSTPKPAAKKTDVVFDAIAECAYGLKDTSNVNGHGASIKAVQKIAVEQFTLEYGKTEPEMIAKVIRMFGMTAHQSQWYKTTFAIPFTAYIQNNRKKIEPLFMPMEPQTRPATQYTMTNDELTGGGS